MTDEESRADLWFRYLTKLNDRALSRQTASGLTTWAVAAVIAALLFQVVDSIPVLTTRPGAGSLHALAIAGTLNVLCFALLLTSSLVVMGMPTMETRLRTRLERVALPIFFVPILMIVAAVSILNFFVSEPAKARGLWRWPFITLGVFFALQIMNPMISQLRKMVRNKGINDLPDLSPPPYTVSQTHRNAFVFGLVAGASIGFVIALVPAVQSLPHITSIHHADALKWAMQVVCILLLSGFLCYRLSGLIRERHLERLERRIVLENLPADEISNLYVLEFLGPTVQDWLAECEQELSRRYTEFEEAANAAEARIRELGDVDPGMTYEIKGRSYEIYKSLEAPSNAYKEYTTGLVSKLRHLARQKAFLSAFDVLEKLIQSLESQAQRINDRLQQVCTTCHEATEGSKEGAAGDDAEQDGCTGH